MECVGFVECPCVKCRQRRREACEAHNRRQDHDRAYCEPCRRKAREGASTAASGYTRCACRDCMDDTVSGDINKPELCELCQEAGCELWTGRAPMSTWYGGQYECQRDDAYMEV